MVDDPEEANSSNNSLAASISKEIDDEKITEIIRVQKDTFVIDDNLSFNNFIHKKIYFLSVIFRIILVSEDLRRPTRC